MSAWLEHCFIKIMLAFTSDLIFRQAVDKKPQEVRMRFDVLKLTY